VLDWRPGIGRSATLSANLSWIWLSATGEAPATPDTREEVSYGGARFTRDGRALYTTSDRDSEWNRLARLDVATGAATYLTSDIPWDVDEFELSPDGRTIAFVTNEDGVSRLYLHDVASGGVGPSLARGADQWPAVHDSGRDLGF
jgi:Tol biopolymer transport system component